MDSGVRFEGSVKISHPMEFALFEFTPYFSSSHQDISNTPSAFTLVWREKDCECYGRNRGKGSEQVPPL